ncbi:DMT family transporter [Streptomonospora nanhaiensis]|uniref:Inner membrane transporter RhtA n=1 Tax=Streptomonospora nanhaiensis TaxID=1323731 RepID=A0A853BEN4_9ACTN|nr:EamA family transporter [Streptomonospora nanhaiensis]MBV2364721.1 EamA family transporter [Streptomonospora nanhaiensis]MBX9389360.1 EamA family transporter [Streptomonospora nanhaiensis]NYI93729.1 inner membrane transporter RhtA [Streptomonospora nanhaiensis]
MWRGAPGWAALLRTAGDSVPPTWLVLVGIVSLQAGAGLAGRMFEVLPPSAVVWLRLLASGLVLLALARPSLRGRSRSDWLVAAGFGVSLGVMNFAIYQAFARIPMGIAVTIEFLGPLAVAVAGSRRRVDLVWVALAGTGVLLLGRSDGAVSPAGVLFALLAGAMWAAYILLSAATGRRFSGMSGLAVAGVVAAVLVAPAGIAEGGTALLDPGMLLLGLAIGLLSSVVPYTLELQALRRMPPRVFGILMSLEPAVAALVGMVLLGQWLSGWQWLAIGCVVAASAGATRRPGAPRAAEAPSGPEASGGAAAARGGEAPDPD